MRTPVTGFSPPIPKLTTASALFLLMALAMILFSTTPAFAQVNTPPTAVDDAATTQQDTPVDVNVLANDTDPDGNTLSVQSATDPAKGTATVNQDGTITYTPDAGFIGTDTFDYTVSDGKGGTDTGTVTVEVTQARHHRHPTRRRQQ